eukprot:3294361-Alexandrium_andersonii.AAC.1
MTGEIPRGPPGPRSLGTAPGKHVSESAPHSDLARPTCPARTARPGSVDTASCSGCARRMQSE